MPRHGKNHNLLSKEGIDQLKAEVRTELDHEAGKGVPRIQAALEKLFKTPGGDVEGEIRRYVYAMSALVEHTRNGGLDSSDIKKIAQLAETVLRIADIPTSNSRLTYLYADLYLVLSQIHRLEGHLVEALWEKQAANALTTKASPERTAFQTLSSGIHLLRMGFAKLAMEEFKLIDRHALETKSQVRWALEQLMALRLSYHLEEAKKFIQDAGPVFAHASEHEKEEWEWEQLCLASQLSGSIDEIMRNALPKKRFAKFPYSAEAFVLARVIKEKNWMERFKNLATKQKTQGPSRSRYEVFWSSASALREGYDADVDYALRLKNIGQVVGKIGELKSIYHEILVRAALVRWLVRRPTHVLETVCVYEYQSLSLRLSDGKCRDVLNLLGDVLQNDGENKVAA